MEKQYRYFDVIMAVFVAVLVVSNVASAAKIVDLSFNLFGLQIPLLTDAGTILFPISYIFGDILTEVYGYKRSRKVVWTGFALLAISSAYFALVGALPGESTWQSYAGDAAYGAILGGMATGGIVLGSLAGYWCGEFTNSFVLAKLKIVTEGRHLWIRTIGSTLAGELVDTLAFYSIASLFGIFPWDIFVNLVLVSYVFKVVIEALMTPVTYWVVNRLKKAENEDYYDRQTNFNPFAV